MYNFIKLYDVINSFTQENKTYIRKVLGINDKNKYLTLKYYCLGIIFVNIAAVIPWYPGIRFINVYSQKQGWFPAFTLFRLF
jgi:uncharacterized membrane protein YukC